MDAIVTQSLGIFSQFVNTQLALAIVFIVELLKVYIPDNIEAKLLPPLAIVIGAALSFIPTLHIGILVGIASGMAATGAYQLGNVGLQKITDAAKGVASSVNPPAQPADPKPQ